MLYGTIFGDIAGSIYEYNPVDKNYKFETISERSHFTDDTTMTLAVASWLMKDKNDLDVLIKEMQYFGRRYPQAGYGGTFRMWLIDPDPKPYNSWGNGSAMRVSPVGWLYDDLTLTEEKAKWSAWVTHNHPEGIKGAQATAAAIWMARKGKTKNEIKEYIESKYGYNLSRTIQEIKDSGYSFDVSCQGSVPESIIAFLEGENFEDCIKKAIYLGGDADTQAAIAGSIAEAFYGFPQHLESIVEEKLDKYLLSVLKAFNNFTGMKNFPIEKEGKTYWVARNVAVACFVFAPINGEWYVLANQRGKGTPDFQGLWNCPCGYLDYNETTKEAAKREVYEETGIQLKHAKFWSFEDSPSSNLQNVTFRYYSIITNPQPINISVSTEGRGGEEDEVGAISWVPISKVETLDWAFKHNLRIAELVKELELV